MKRYVDIIERLFDDFEKNRMSEKEIFEKCINLVRSHKNDPDYTWDLNDTLYNRGYSCQFVVRNAKRKFDKEAYIALTSQVTKSKVKTQALIDYLKQTKDHRLILSSLHMLKVQHLIDLGYMLDGDLLDGCRNLTLRELFYGYYHNEEIKTTVKNTLENIGMADATLQYNDFRMDMEYLLWTIERDEPKYGHIKINTIKVALQIAPKDYFERDDKVYYSTETSKDGKKYLKLIDKNAIAEMKSKWGEMGYGTLHDGYRLLHQYI